MTNRSDATSNEQFLRTNEPRECPACWGNGYTLDRHDERLPCSICAETGKVVPYFAPSASSEALRLLREAYKLAGKSMGDSWYEQATALLSK